ncbi:MAG: thioredoxin-like domain-containing protein [Verrucomicrobiota bacterium]
MTAQLVQLYEKAGDDRKFEVVLFGYDRDQASLEAYMKKSKMAFPAVNKADMAAVKDLGSLGETGYIPNVVLVTPDGKLVDNDQAKVFEKIQTL